MRKDDIYKLPLNLPVPLDDGKCNHLQGMTVPTLRLLSTSSEYIDLSKIKGIVVLFCFPRAGRPDVEPPTGWHETPGARGCTPQSMAYKEHFSRYKDLGVTVYGLSTQTHEDQLEVKQRLNLPFDLLSDSDFAFCKKMRLPTLKVSNLEFVKRITLVIENTQIKKVFYPVFPPDQNAEEVLAWLNER